MENKFAPMAIKIPLENSHKEALKKIRPITGKMKREFTFTYASYVCCMCVGYFLPAFFAKILGDAMTKPMTLAFSNIPGILRPMQYKGT